MSRLGNRSPIERILRNVIGGVSSSRTGSRLPSFREVRDAIQAIDGHTSVPECEFLFDKARLLTSGCIVEVGSYRGRSTVALAFGAKASGRDTPVFAIEPHEVFKGALGGEFGPEDRRAFYQSMLDTGSWSVVRLVNLSSQTVTPGWAMPVGLLWLDGDHSYEGVSRDFMYWRPFMQEGAVALFHDATEAGFGPAILVDELLESGMYVEIEAVGLIRGLVKVGDATK